MTWNRSPSSPQPGRRRLLHAGISAVAATVLPAGARSSVAGSPTVAVCLGSGSLHGFAHVGVIRAFHRLGLKPDLIAGSSVGAIAGVLWAAGLDADTIEELARDPSWREVNRLRWPRLGLGRLERLEGLIDRHAGRIETLPTRFLAVATDLATGRPVTLDRGQAGAAIAASAAVPLRFEPVSLDGRLLVDGALSAPIPVDAARAAGADITVAVDVAYRPYEAPVNGLMDVAYQAMHILVNRLIDEQIKRATHAIRLDVHALVQQDASMQAVILAGEQAVVERWATLRPFVPPPVRARSPCRDEPAGVP